MRIEITLRSGAKAILDSNSMTFKTGKDTFRLPFWPIKEVDGTQVCDNSAVVSWKEILDEPKPASIVPELPVLPSPSVHDSGRAEGKEQSTRPQLPDENVRVPSPSPVPSSGTDWIK